MKRIYYTAFFIIFGFFNCLSPNTSKEPIIKKYISANQLLKDSFNLGKLIFESGFRPTYLIALWRGGAPIGIAIDEYFRYKKQPIANHTAVRVSAYNGNQLKEEITVFNLDYVKRTITSDDKLLIVDDVVDSGSTIKKILEEIKEQCGENAPKEIKTATVYYKPKFASTVPDYHIHKTDKWIVFPHGLEDLTKSEIETYKGTEIADILK